MPVVRVCYFKTLVATPRLTSIISNHNPLTIGKLYSRDFEPPPKIPGFYRLLGCQSGSNSSNSIISLAFVDYSCSPPVHLIPFRGQTEKDYITDKMDIALNRRSQLNFPEGAAYRLMNSYHDLLPGLTVDIYGNHAVICAYSKFWEKETLTIQKHLLDYHSKLESIRYFCKQKGSKDYSCKVLWGAKTASCTIEEVS